MQETQTNGQTFSNALISMSNLKLLCRMDSIADVKRFVNFNDYFRNRVHGYFVNVILMMI